MPLEAPSLPDTMLLFTQHEAREKTHTALHPRSFPDPEEETALHREELLMDGFQCCRDDVVGAMAQAIQQEIEQLLVRVQV